MSKCEMIKQWMELCKSDVPAAVIIKNLTSKNNQENIEFLSSGWISTSLQIWEEMYEITYKELIDSFYYLVRRKIIICYLDSSKKNTQLKFRINSCLQEFCEPFYKDQPNNVFFGSSFGIILSASSLILEGNNLIMIDTLLKKCWQEANALGELTYPIKSIKFIKGEI